MRHCAHMLSYKINERIDIKEKNVHNLQSIYRKHVQVGCIIYTPLIK